MTFTAASHQGASRCFGFTSREFSVSGMQLKRLLAGHFYMLHHVPSDSLSVRPSGERASWQRQDMPGPDQLHVTAHYKVLLLILFFIWLCWKKMD